jgi:hypothetical protein
VLVIRLVLVLGVLLIGGAFALYVFSRDRRYLRFAWQALRFAIVVLSAVVIFLFIERLA